MMTRLLRNIFIFAVAIVASMVYGVTANAEELSIDNTVKYTVPEGSIYWERSEQWGSGSHNTVCDENRYTDISCGELSVWIDGYSVIDQNGDIVESSFDEKVQKLSIPVISSEQELMVHIWSADEGGYRLGWIKFSEVSYNEDKSEYITSEIPEGKEEEWFENEEEKTVEQTADTLKKKVKEDSEIPRESYILADFSGSMSDFQLDVLEKLEGTAGKKYVFAEDIEEFVFGKDTWTYNIGGATNIANALNTVNIKNDSHIYILSDLNDNCETEIESNEDFVGEITIVYYPVDFMYAMDFMERLRESYPNATITGF